MNGAANSAACRDSSRCTAFAAAPTLTTLAYQQQQQRQQQQRNTTYWSAVCYTERDLLKLHSNSDNCSCRGRYYSDYLRGGSRYAVVVSMKVVVPPSFLLRLDGWFVCSVLWALGILRRTKDEFQEGNVRSERRYFVCFSFFFRQ